MSRTQIGEGALESLGGREAGGAGGEGSGREELQELGGWAGSVCPETPKLSVQGGHRGQALLPFDLLQ